MRDDKTHDLCKLTLQKGVFIAAPQYVVRTMRGMPFIYLSAWHAKSAPQEAVAQIFLQTLHIAQGKETLRFV